MSGSGPPGAAPAGSYAGPSQHGGAGGAPAGGNTGGGTTNTTTSASDLNKIVSIDFALTFTSASTSISPSFRLAFYYGPALNLRFPLITTNFLQRSQFPLIIPISFAGSSPPSTILFITFISPLLLQQSDISPA